jgi:hypothetical protein
MQCPVAPFRAPPRPPPSSLRCGTRGPHSSGVRIAASFSCSSVVLRSFTALALLISANGCTVISIAGKTATTTVGVATDVAAATVRGTGKVAAAAVGASGDVADESLRTGAKLAKSGAVVVFDPRTGLTREVPWSSGLDVAFALELARIDAAHRALRIIRGGKAVTVGHDAKAPLRSGDVVELTAR